MFFSVKVCWQRYSIHARFQYLAFSRQFGEIWSGLGWKVSTWVHWVVCHSHALASRHRNFYLFSSIPTERRNAEFKLDVTHCFKGWKLSRPQASTRGFALVLELSALDVGLLLELTRKGDELVKKRRRSHWHWLFFACACRFLQGIPEGFFLKKRKDQQCAP